MTTEFSNNFIDAFNHLMLDEVGRGWDPKDPDTIAGRCDTYTQKRKVGYVNIPEDSGGETKYGIAKNANPDVDIAKLDMAGAMEIYNRRYWLNGSCDKLSAPVSAIHFDGVVNTGVGRANKFLQKAVGAIADGQIGPATLNKISAADQREIVIAISKLRTQFYLDIVANKPSQKKFLNGWMSRINNITFYALSKF